MNLPRGKDTTRAQSAFGLILLQGVERITTALRRGDPFTEDGLSEMIKLRSRLSAFNLALEERLRLHGLEELFEEADVSHEE